MVRLRLKRKCDPPERYVYTDEDLKKVKLPQLEKVLEKLRKIVKDENVAFVIEELERAIYQLDENSEFIKWLKSHALNYKIYRKEDKMIDYMLSMSLAFIAYCKEKIYGDSKLHKIVSSNKVESLNLSEPQCIVVIDIIESLKGHFTGLSISKAKLLLMARKWKKETDKIKKIWYNIENNWCKW